MIYGKFSINALGIPKFKDFLFVDGLKVKIISISQICDDKCFVKFIHKECIIYDNIGSAIIKCIKFEDNYYCIGDSLSLLCNKVNLSI